MKFERLGNVCDFQGGTQPPKNEWSDYPQEGFIRMLQIRDFTQPKSENIQYVSQSNKLNTCKEDDVLIGRYGASVGKILTGLEGAYNVALIKTIPDIKKIDKKYLFFLLKSPLFQRYILGVGGRAAQAGFNKADLEKFKIPLPSLTDQQKIAQLLERVEKLIEERKASIELLDELVRSTFLDMFGDPVRNEKGFKVESLGKLTVSKNNKRIPLKASDRALIEGDVPYYGASGVIDYVDDYTHEGENLLIGEDGANLLSRNTPIAYRAFGKYWVNNHAHVLASGKEVSLAYLEHFINLIDLKPYVSGSAQPKLNKSNLDRIKVIKPPKDLQKRFESLIDIQIGLKSNFEKSLQELEQLFAALSQQAFKGELDVSKVKLSEKRKVYVKNLELSTGKPKDEKTNAATHKQPTKKLKQDNESDSKWKYLRTLGGAVDSKIPFNAIEGKEVLETAFSKKEYGFRFGEFENFLEKERFSFTYEQTRDFIFQELEEGNLEQLYIADDFIDFGEEANPRKFNQGEDGKLRLKVKAKP